MTNLFYFLFSIKQDPHFHKTILSFSGVMTCKVKWQYICFYQLSVKILFLHSLKYCDDRRLINHSSLVNLHPGLLSPVSGMVTVLLSALLFCSVKVGKRQTAGLRCMKCNHGKSNSVSMFGQTKVFITQKQSCVIMREVQWTFIWKLN